jgi:hypothetical protein
MEKYLAALFLAVSCTAIADSPTQLIPDNCGTEKELLIALDQYDELPFVWGTRTRKTTDGIIQTSIIMFVNAEKNTWTLVEHYPNGLYCFLAGGVNFEPVPADTVDNMVKQRQRKKI